MTKISDPPDEHDRQRDSTIVVADTADPAGEHDPRDRPPLDLPSKPGEAVHWVFLILGVLVVVLSFTMRAPGEVRVYLPFIDVPLPGSCVSRELAGVDCPGCGLTRAFISLAHGEFVRAWYFNPASFLIFVVVAGQIPYRIMQLWRIRRGREVWHLPAVMFFLYLAVFVLMLQWSVRRIMEWLSS